MKSLVAIFLLLSMMAKALACAAFIPANNLSFPADEKGKSGLTEDEFNESIDEIRTIYTPIFKSLGAKLNIKGSWKDDRVNAGASRSVFANTWDIEMFGGLARHPDLTRDAFLLTACHEVGHHIGGASKHLLLFWMSVEGEADYFGTLKCLRRVFLNDDNSAIVKRMNVPEVLRKSCTNEWSQSVDRDICMRSGMAALSITRVIAPIFNEAAPKFETPSTEVSLMTKSGYPTVQCRLDTFLQGSLCEKPFTEDVSQKDATVGTCMDGVGARPACWFKPKDK